MGVMQNYQNVSIQDRKIQYKRDQMQVSNVEMWCNSPTVLYPLVLIPKPSLRLDLIDPQSSFLSHSELRESGMDKLSSYIS